MVDHDPRRDLRLMRQSIGNAAALYQGVPKRALLMFVVLAICIFVSMGASAAEYSSGLDSILGNYKTLSGSWYTKIKGFAERLFWLLVLVDFGWSAVIYALEKGDVGEIAGSIAKKIFTIGFFWALLKLSDTWIPAIIDSFARIGTEVGKVAANSATPDGIVKLGWEYADSAFKALSDLSLTESIGAVIPVAVVALLIFMCFLFVSLTLMITLLESYMVIGAGVILLGFGGSRWTTDFATKYLQHAVGTGLKLMLIYLLVGAAASLFDNIVLDPNNLIQSLFSLLGTAAAYAYFIIKVPQIASAMMSGSPALTTGDAMGTALAVGAAMAGAGAAATMAGSTALGGVGGAAAGATGLGKALGAGVSSGLDMGKSGMGLATHAVGEVAKHGLGLGASGIGDAVNRATTAFADKVDSSAGGKIASGIEATRGGNIAGAPPPAGGGSASAPAPTGGGASGKGANSGGIANTGNTGGSPAGSQIVDSSGKPLASSAGAPGTAPPPPANTGPTPNVGTGTAGASPSAAPAGMDVSGAVGGDASTASLSGGPNVEQPKQPERPKNPLSERIQGMQGYVPQDMAGGAAINLDVRHTQD